MVYVAGSGHSQQAPVCCRGHSPKSIKSQSVDIRVQEDSAVLVEHPFSGQQAGVKSLETI